PAIGFSPKAKFQQDEIEISFPSRIYLFSDGVFEIKTKNGRWLNRDAAVDLLAGLALLPGEEDLERLEEALRACAANPDFSDDFTLLRVDFR
ncbi:MAG: serine/threonine-protein phosphatase, partial [Planctomycetota bacterium]|nr:serine/threonine-protein phosphatase [Planctomycetota bacterium]